MAGIYLHIPFCRKACHYCNFHFSTSLRLKGDLLDALHLEIIARKDEMVIDSISSIYFGGGTPSILTGEELSALLSLVREHYPVDPMAEITLEANPDDLSESYLDTLLDLGVNRLSIGIQSFAQADLEYMHRSHTADQAEQVLHLARKTGFQHVNADLIYGTPGMTDDTFRMNIRRIVDAGVDHLSAYALTVEPKTALSHFIRSVTAPPPDDEQTVRQFALLRQAMKDAGYDHYEISNWSLPGRHSRHNTSYWQGTPYLGFGPAAHSYNGQKRSWNVANNPKYIAGMKAGTPDREIEVLSEQEIFNEYVLTRLRTKWGCDMTVLSQSDRQHFLNHITPFLERGWVSCNEEIFTLTETGLDFADLISSELFRD
ncbi:MAG: radical SAM family heme chaperone HemW [Saprospiraceae bacterium]|nr:radical SAM family heme chaperone HemW [Saprospiraceae bacterium]